MKVLHKKKDHKGEFYIQFEKEIVAHMTYSMAGSDKMIIDHTQVNDSLKGQGIGNKLLDAAVQYARDNNVKILPLCPFANAVFKKRKDYYDVLI